MNSSININNFFEDDRKKIFGHNDISGIRQGKFITTTGIDINSINNSKQCVLFIDGHLHNGYIQNKLILPGNLTGQNFNEDANKFRHQIYILDITDNSVSYESFENPHAFNFYKLNFHNKEDLYKLDNLDNNSVVSIACTNELCGVIENVLKTRGVNKYKLYIIYNEEKEINTEQFKIVNHISQFIEYAEKNLQPSKELTYELSKLGEAI